MMFFPAKTKDTGVLSRQIGRGVQIYRSVYASVLENFFSCTSHLQIIVAQIVIISECHRDEKICVPKSGLEPATSCLQACKPDALQTELPRQSVFSIVSWLCDPSIVEIMFIVFWLCSLSPFVHHKSCQLLMT